MSKTINFLTKIVVISQAFIIINIFSQLFITVFNGNNLTHVFYNMYSKFQCLFVTYISDKNISVYFLKFLKENCLRIYKKVKK